MKAVVRRGKALVQTDVPDVRLQPGQVLARTLACGICGSDLHAVHHLDTMVEMSRRAGSSSTLDPERDLVLGHEFCAEIVEFGPQTTRRLAPGARVVSVPYNMGPNGPELIGFSNRFPGGFAEYMALTEATLLEAPNGLPSEHAAMVEPMSVGAHAVNCADLSGRPVALVVGCGPVGLAVIAALKLRGVGPVIASDYSAARRRIAELMGADIVVDPAQTSPHDRWEQFDTPATLAAFSKARMFGRDVRRAVIFECVGVPGLIQSLIEKCPPTAQIVVVGACMEEDSIVPVLAINKQLRLQFVFAYTQDEFARTLHDMAQGRIDVAPMYSGTVGLSGVADAFAALAAPEQVKIIVDPRLP